MAVDPLAEVVTLLHPSLRSSKLVEFAGGWRIHRTGSGDPFYCAVLDGQFLMTVDGQTPMLLQAGDFVLVPAMRAVISESLDAPTVETTPEPIQMTGDRFRVGPVDVPASLTMRIGHCRFASPDAELLVRLLPGVILARDEPRLATLMQFVGEESYARRPAHEIVLERLLELVLIEAMRSGSAAMSAPGLALGLADQHLAAALRAFHAQPELSWTVVELAAKAALSRSAFFARFRRIVGLPPMEYLLAWRMALAKRLLCDRDLGVEQVAERVGYSSASTFSVAFSRYTGLSPARYGREHKAA